MAERASGRSPSPEEVLPLGVLGARPPGSLASGGSSARSLDAGSSAAWQFGRLKEFGRGESEGVRPPRKFGLDAGSPEEAWKLTSSACWKKLGRWVFG
ncbi:hypothetical protein COCNU_scaffold003416G000010 [Cocos nucifera]|nr:hypothetical protein [Cocos nucifera]